MIKYWKDEDVVYYDDTEGYKEALAMVQSQSVVTIIGSPGSGKTATARHIALQMEKEGWEIVPVCKIEDILKYSNINIKQIFVLDDVFGILSMNMNNYNDLICYSETLLRSIGEESKLVFTCRKTVYNEALSRKPFVLDFIVDLQNTKNELTEADKVKILTNHCTRANVAAGIYGKIPLNSTTHSFPLLCKLFANDQKYQKYGVEFFSCPSEYLIGEMSKLRGSSTYAVLVLCLLNQNTLSAEKLPSEVLKREVYDTCGLNRDTPDRKITDSMENMLGSYLSKSENTYTFLHDSLFEVIAYHYGKDCPKQMMKYMSSSFIASKVVVSSQSTDDDLVIVLGEHQYQMLAERLYRDLKKMEFYDVFMNKSLLHTVFMNTFLKFITDRPYVKFKSLFLSRKKITKQFFTLKKVRNHKLQEKTDEFSKSSEVKKNEYELLLDRINDSHRNSTDSMTIISWIVYYGHSKLLKTIVSHVKSNGDSVDLIFGDKVEQTRLLTLSCYSGDYETVITVLQYVDKECVNCTSLCEDQHDRRLTGLNKHRCYTPFTATCHSRLVNTVSEQKVLHHETQKRHHKIVECLSRNGGKINNLDGYYRSPLHLVSEVVSKAIHKYHDKNVGNINLLDYKKEIIPRHESAPNYTVVRKNVSILDKDNSSLHKASNDGNIDNVKYIVENGGNVNSLDKDNQSPLHQASQAGHIEIVKYLIKKGGNVNILDKDELSPLHRASVFGHIDIVTYLVENGGNVNSLDKENQSPLHQASQAGHIHIVKYLVKKKGNVNLLDKAEQSPLHRASVFGHIDIVTYLVENGGNVNSLDKDNKSPLHQAIEAEHFDIVNYLVKKGGRRNILE